MAEDELWAPAPSRPPTTTVDLGLPGLTRVQEIARGGESVVYRAYQAALDRDVAVKVLLETDPATLARFRRELEITVRLGRQHPHIVTVLDTSTTLQGNPCLVMDFHDLGSLHDRLRSHGPLPVAEVVAAGTAVADALAFAHSHGVLHRDVKPQNVLLLPTSYVLTDFGIARMAGADHTASLERFSYRHASPQVLDGLEPTVADDVWSLGSTLFTLLDGRAPFSAADPGDDTALGYLRRVRTGARRPLGGQELPPGLREIVDRCLASEREDRYGAAAEIYEALRRLPTETRTWAPSPAATTSGAAAAPVPAPDPAPSRPGDGSTPPSTSGEDAPAAGLAGLALPPVEPRSPGPLAPSALGLLDLGAAPGGPGALDDEATGLHRTAASAPEPRPAVPDGPDGSEESGPRGRRRSRATVAAFVGGAVLLGSAVGVAVPLWTGARVDRQDALEPSVPAPTAGEVPVEGDPLPVPEGPVQALISDPELEPRDVVAIDRGTSVELSWTDPTGGQVLSVVVDPDSDEDRPLALKAAELGVTEVTIEGIDPEAPQVCLQVVAVDVADSERVGVSEPACVRR
ncbi:serine/threonine protein kinase [Actinotalea sp. BY-33]|uniref:non-specific serine/threonine protein kinase n=1 Tax=Actinotalea soli TaxID=2819234 RepID=A0A939LMX1_9CELL|nr:serine/threonine-protein kinase [Actinotalea soli]MBO1750786.1 serine/threonine protein kinase [Actinotalea soli]